MIAGLAAYRFIVTVFAVIMLSVSQSACQGTIEIVIDSAYAEAIRADGLYRVHANVNRRDISAILDSEIYSHLVVFDCGSGNLRYPIEPNIGSVPLNSFALANETLASNAAALVELEGGIPASVMRRFDRPCIRMDGGSYLGLALSSNVVSLRMQ